MLATGPDAGYPTCNHTTTTTTTNTNTTNTTTLTQSATAGYHCLPPPPSTRSATKAQAPAHHHHHCQPSAYHPQARVHLHPTPFLPHHRLALHHLSPACLTCSCCVLLLQAGESGYPCAGRRQEAALASTAQSEGLRPEEEQEAEAGAEGGQEAAPGSAAEGQLPLNGVASQAPAAISKDMASSGQQQTQPLKVRHP